MKIDLAKGTKENLPIARNLVHYYIYDMGVPMKWDPREDGVYDGCDEMIENWTNEDYHSFLLYSGKIPIGFAVVKAFSEDEFTYELEEFFVLRGYRKLGIGKEISHKLFKDFIGNWQVRVLKQNTPAISFWKKVITSFSNDKFDLQDIVHHCPYSGDWQMKKFTFMSWD